jgi:hypothetical protein
VSFVVVSTSCAAWFTSADSRESNRTASAVGVSSTKLTAPDPVTPCVTSHSTQLPGSIAPMSAIAGPVGGGRLFQLSVFSPHELEVGNTCGPSTVPSFTNMRSFALWMFPTKLFTRNRRYMSPSLVVLPAPRRTHESPRIWFGLPSAA